MRLATEHSRAATVVAIGLLALVLSAGLVARATAGGAGSPSPRVQAYIAELRRENAQLHSDGQRQAREIGTERSELQSLTGQLQSTRWELQRARSQRDARRHG